jgi:HPt (histidine-containing phosphotransfer) domain-containing protein
MRTIRSRQDRAVVPDPPEDSFEEIRAAFCVRLQSEKAHFLTLNASLARAEEHPTPILDDLRNRAHRLSGTAAIFEYGAIAAAARALELAVVSASALRAKIAQPAIARALEVLIGHLVVLEEDANARPIAAAGLGSRRARAVLHG